MKPGQDVEPVDAQAAGTKSGSAIGALILFVLAALVGAAGCKLVDVWWGARASSRFENEFVGAQAHSAALAKSLAETPPKSAEFVSRLLDSTRKFRHDLINEEARALLLLNIVDLGLIRTYFRSAEFQDSQVEMLREQLSRDARGLKSEAKAKRQPDEGEATVTPERLIPVLEGSALEDRKRAMAAIARLRWRCDPFLGGGSAPKPATAASSTP